MARAGKDAREPAKAVRSSGTRPYTAQINYRESSQNFNLNRRRRRDQESIVSYIPCRLPPRSLLRACQGDISSTPPTRAKYKAAPAPGGRREEDRRQQASNHFTHPGPVRCPRNGPRTRARAPSFHTFSPSSGGAIVKSSRRSSHSLVVAIGVSWSFSSSLTSFCSSLTL